MKATPPSKEQAYWAAVRSDFRVFISQAFVTLYPGKSFDDNWHIGAIVHALEQNLHGATPRLIINLPPRHLKSFLVSVAWPAFLLGVDPSLKIFCVSYSDDLSKTIARDCRRLMSSDWYRRVFSHVRLEKDTENEIVTDQGGFRSALSVNGSITGRGADLIIIDDPSRPEDVVSDKARDRINEWFRSTLLTRRDDKLLSGLILVMQRLHVNDLTGFAEARGGFHKLSFPAIAEREEVVELRHGQIYRRLVGEALQPEREDLAVLQQMRDEIGEFHFEAQYQQSPKAPDGVMFKRKYFKLIDHLPRIRPEGEFFISIDSALSTSSSADFTAISIVYIDLGELYVIRGERGRWDYEALKARTFKWVEKLARPQRRVNIVVENAGSGISLSHYLVANRDEGRYRFEPYLPRADKVTRAARVLPWFENGIFIVNKAGENAWVEPYLNEFMNFPNGANDDQVDSLVQLLSMNYARSFVKRPKAEAPLAL
jgi:predicted phage terminase large subunit-like protein